MFAPGVDGLQNLEDVCVLERYASKSLNSLGGVGGGKALEVLLVTVDIHFESIVTN